MKTRLLKLIALLLICALSFSLTGCDKLDYHKAVDLYNQGKFDAAAEAFSALGDYEDSAALSTRSHYWAAVTLAEAGNYAEALPRFLKLGDYENAAQWVTECTYQMAIAAFDAGNLTDARIYFQEAADYKQAGEYLRRITWQDFFDAVAASGGIQKEQDGKVFSITADTAEANQLVLCVSSDKNLGYRFQDDLTLTLQRDSTVAAFTATSTFYMPFNQTRIGSQQIASGTVDIATCSAATVLTPEDYKKTVSDNLGNTTTTNDPAENLMQADMAENLADLLTVLPELLLEAGIELTLKDIGFAAI